MKESGGESEKGEREKMVKLETSSYFSGYLRHFKLKWKKNGGQCEKFKSQMSLLFLMLGLSAYFKFGFCNF